MTEEGGKIHNTQFNDFSNMMTSMYAFGLKIKKIVGNKLKIKWITLKFFECKTINVYCDNSSWFNNVRFLNILGLLSCLYWRKGKKDYAFNWEKKKKMSFYLMP